jgi:pimeloyl-ACP methyl ester carboxylesterase
MIFRVVKWSLLVAVILVGGVASYMHFSAQAALDTDFTYTAAVSKLPLLSDSSGDGLVRIQANNMEFRARVAGFDGNPDKPTAILLHGFPVTSAMYEDLIPVLANRGYRVLAPDQRGYSPGARPEGAGNYTVDQLTADIIALADAAGIDTFHLVGHDWGAVIGWSVVLTHPQRVISWSGLSIAHPAAFSAALENDPDQKARSRYFFLFATPWLAETMFAMNDFAAVQGMHSTMTPEQAAEYNDMLREPGALTAALNWYRAVMAEDMSPPSGPMSVETPTVFIWGNNDEAVGRYSVEQQAQYMKGPYKELELDAGHWLFRDQPEKTLAAITDHIDTYSVH